MEQNASAKIVLLIVGVAVIVIGGFLYYAMQMDEQPAPGTGTGQTAPPSDQLSGTADVEADLQGIDLEGLDTELGDIEKEIAQ